MLLQSFVGIIKLMCACSINIMLSANKSMLKYKHIVVCEIRKQANFILACQIQT